MAKWTYRSKRLKGTWYSTCRILGRNTLQGPGYAQLDLRWSYNFFLMRSKKEKGPTLTPAVDAFNVFNRVNFVAFVGNLSSPFFGQAVAARPPRRLQLSLRLTF